MLPDNLANFWDTSLLRLLFEVPLKNRALKQIKASALTVNRT